MNRISVLVKKTPKLNNSFIYHYIDYQKELTYAAKEFPGFIKTESYTINELFDENNVNYDNVKKIINISTWTNVDFWNNWYYSNKRNEIKKKYDNTIKSEEITILKNKDYFDDTFLL